jgi:hypothetical protein
MYDKKGKQTGLMMEGSVAHMETMGQEKKNLINDMPIDNRGVGQMSPYKMDHPGESGEKKTKTKEETKDAYIDKMLNKLQKEKPGMDPMEMMKYAKNSYEALPPEEKEK